MPAQRPYAVKSLFARLITKYAIAFEAWVASEELSCAAPIRWLRATRSGVRKIFGAIRAAHAAADFVKSCFALRVNDRSVCFTTFRVSVVDATLARVIEIANRVAKFPRVAPSASVRVRFLTECSDVFKAVGTDSPTHRTDSFVAVVALWITKQSSRIFHKISFALTAKLIPDAAVKALPIAVRQLFRRHLRGDPRHDGFQIRLRQRIDPPIELNVLG